MITPLMDFEFYISNIDSVYCLAGIMIFSRPRRMIHGPALHEHPQLHASGNRRGKIIL